MTQTPIPQPLADAIAALKFYADASFYHDAPATIRASKKDNGGPIAYDEGKRARKALAVLEAFAGKEATIESLAKCFEEQAIHAAELNGDKTYYVWEAGVNRSLFDELRGVIDRARKSTFAGKDEEPDYWYCDIDPDEGGESAYEAMHGYRQRLTPVELHTNYIGPTKWGVITQKEIASADSDGEEEALVFDSEEDARRFCDERIAAIAQITKQDGE